MWGSESDRREPEREKIEMEDDRFPPLPGFPALLFFLYREKIVSLPGLGFLSYALRSIWYYPTKFTFFTDILYYYM